MNRLGGLRVCPVLPRCSPTWCRVSSLSSRPPPDCYATLGVNYKADQKQIKEKFYSLSKEYHPDLNKDNEAALRKFKEVAEAYEILSNPEKRAEYDQKMGFFRSSVNPNASAAPFSSKNGGRRRFNGMKGEFRNGRFVDDEATPEMRNIEYDLSPERMEKIWKRYKTRWERVDEIKKWEEIEEKKIEFRRKFDLKREKMIQNKMSKEEKEEFMYKIRLHRVDAVEGSDTSTETTDIKEKNKSEKKVIERQKLNSKDLNQKEKSKHNSNKKEEKGKKHNQSDTEDSEKEFEKNTRDILKNHFGLSEEELDRLDIGGSGKKTRGRDDRSHGLHRNDPLYHGLKSGADAIDWRDYVKKTYEKNKDTWAKLKTNRIENAVNSDRYNIRVQKEDHYGTKIVIVILLSAIVLGYRELSLERNNDH